jgi:hypothetical protein
MRPSCAGSVQQSGRGFMATKSGKRAKPLHGPRGAKGARGAPGITPEALKTLIRNMEQTQADAAIQFTRIAQLQVQVDETLKALKDMGEKAGRQRKK